MKIHVVDIYGESISLGKSLLRTAILTISYFLNGAMISIEMGPFAGALLGLLIFGVGGSIIYLYLFNRKTRQSFHDLMIGYFVVKKNVQGPLTVPPVAPIHYGVIGVLFVASILFFTIVGAKLNKKWQFPELMNIYQKLQKMDGISLPSVVAGKNFGPAGEQTYLGVNIIMRKKPQSFEGTASEAAHIILTNYPNALDKQFLAVSVIYGFDIGIASAWQRNSSSHSPEEWRSIIDKKILEPTTV